MPAQELAFETLQYALETTRGTAIAAPTFALNVEGSINPIIEMYRPTDALGTLAEFNRSEAVRTSAEIEGEGAMDANRLHHLGTMALNGSVTAPTTPTNGVLTRLWTFTRTMTADNLKSATWFWGDPNLRIWQGKYGLLTELGLAGDASGTDGATMSIAGISHLTDIATPTMAAVSAGPLISPAKMQVWMDTGTIGTTALTGRVVSAEITIPTGVTPKYVATGPTGGLTYDLIGRAKTHPEMTLTLMMADMTQYNLWKASSTLKVRVRFNGPLIESVTPDYYYYVEVDMVGTSDSISWGDLEGTNRTMEMTLIGQYDSSLSSDCIMRVQNTKEDLTT